LNGLSTNITCHFGTRKQRYKRKAQQNVATEQYNKPAEKLGAEIIFE